MKIVFEMFCKDSTVSDKILSKLQSYITEKQFIQLERTENIAGWSCVMFLTLQA